jgi:hypothetical protein
MLPWDLEDWITDAGAAVLDKRMSDPTRLSVAESLVYEIWLLDTEARNGGLSQYFCNRGLAQWQSCVAAAKNAGLQAFAPFERELDAVIARSPDPYSAIRERGDAAEDLWFVHQHAVVQALRAYCASTA